MTNKTNTSLTRGGFLAALTGAALAALAAPAHAARNPDAEQFVQRNATAAINALSQSDAADARQRAFGRLMTEFADVPRIAAFVLGRYAQQLRTNDALRREWLAAFQDYSNAVYEYELDRYRGNSIRVTDSREFANGNEVIVVSEVAARSGGRAQRVQWRVRRAGQTWKVVDVALLIDGNEIWLAQRQQGDFLAQLDRSRGDINALIAYVRQATARMRRQIAERS